YRLSGAARAAMIDYIARRRGQPGFANARSIRNAIDRARLRQAMRLCAGAGVASRDDLQTIEAEDIRASRVFTF
ncbi:MAG TPA: CbbX protein, partial [Pseudolabrys sp.]|nr:CbbX protein [Pseudolabrys sp.]